MDAHEALAELVLQRLQRLVQQHLAASVTQGHVLVVGDEEDHLFQRNQLDALAGPCADMAARAGAAGRRRLGQRGELHAVRPRSLLQRLGQVFGAHRLDQVADRADLEGFQGEFVVGGTEDHRRRGFALAQLGGNLQAIEAGHADIQQDDIRLQAVDQRQRFFAIAGGGLEDAVSVHLPHQPGKALTRQGFVIDDQDIHRLKLPA
ncbi:hypothetical protein D9M71_488410 [compost metagenome]